MTYREEDTMHPHPRDPRQRRAGASIDPAAAAIRLEVAAASMRANLTAPEPEPAELPTLEELYRADGAHMLADVLAADRMATAVQLGTVEPPLTAREFAAALGDLDDIEGREPLPGRDYDVEDVLEDVAESPEPVPVAAPVPPVDGDAPAPAPTIGAPFAAHERELDGVAFSSEQPRALDWRSRHDPQSRHYGVRARLAGSAPLTDHVWPVGEVLDQQAEGACVGFAIIDAINAAAAGDADRGAPDALALFHRADQIDGDGRTGVGTSVLAGMQAGVEAGLFGGYRWCFGTRDLAQTILQVGPVVIGVPWLSGMYDTGPGGLVRVEGDDTGAGHALAVVGLKLKGPQGQPGPYFVWLNSWGTGYGDGGIGYVHHRDLARLLHGVGEAAIPTRDRQVPGVQV